MLASQEIIDYPTSDMIQHLKCRHVKESDIDFEAHMSGFVYKVRVNGQTLIKKEIPGPDTVDEFLYEINALSQLRNSNNVIPFYGIIVDDYGEHVKGLLISYAAQGALIDVIYDHDHSLSWPRRQKWARQIVEGLADIHEAGFVQGDFTLANIVIDDRDNAKIIDCNRRGCPVGWEPPEATPLIESNQRISMYIGVKSDLYQLGMVLWALAEQEDEPENQLRPLTLSEGLDLPDWYQRVVRICLAENPRYRMQAIDLLRLFPPLPEAGADGLNGVPPSISVDDGFVVQEFLVNEYQTGDGPIIKTVQAPSDWNPRGNFDHTYVDSPTASSSEPYCYPTRGRSPPSPIPSNLEYRGPRWGYRGTPWADARDRSFERTRSSSGLHLAPDETAPGDEEQSVAPHAQNDIPHEEKVERKPASDLEVTEVEFATPMQEEQGNPTGEKGKQLGGAAEEASRDLESSMKHPEDVDGREGFGPLKPNTQVTRRLDDVDTQDIASRSKGAGVYDFLSTDYNTTAPAPAPAPAPAASPLSPPQNPLFREAGKTEPEAPRTTALVSRAAEIQNAKSTSTILDTRQGQKAERNDSAVEMSMSPSMMAYPPGLHKPRPHADSAVHMAPIDAGTKMPDALLYLGAGHDHPGDEEDVRRGSAGTIAEDDLVEP